MRTDILRGFTNSLQVIDTHVPFYNISRIWRTIGFRWKIGPLITKTSNYILSALPPEKVDLIWVDKGIFILPSVLKVLKSKTKKLVHFTPDTAFYQNSSSLFAEGISHYNYLFTTKSFDLKEYTSLVSENKVILTTQGYNPEVHKPFYAFDKKFREVVFIGLSEPNRKEVIQALLNAGIKVSLAGYGWKDFVAKNQNNHNLEWIGEKVSGSTYGELISSAYMSLGLLSKRFPELHTTRTFEIPACQTLLLTERNKETSAFFSESEAAFFSDQADLIAKINSLLEKKTELKAMTDAGYKKVTEAGYDYKSVLKRILEQIS